MTIEINNISTTDAVIEINNRSIKLPKHKTLTLNESGSDIVLGIHSKMNTSYNRYASNFVVLSEYKIFGDEKVTLCFEFQSVKAKVKANHTYHRFAETSGKYNAVYSILPEGKKKLNLGLGFLVNLPLTLIFEGAGILAISAIVGLITANFFKAVIAFLICIAAISLYEVFENVILDKLFKKSKLIKRTEEPLFLEACSKSDFIEYCFDVL